MPNLGEPGIFDELYYSLRKCCEGDGRVALLMYEAPE